MRACVRFEPDLPETSRAFGTGGSNVSLDWRVSGIHARLVDSDRHCVSTDTALQSSRGDLSGTLRESGNRSGTGMRHNTTRALLVTTEMALAVVLSIGAGLLIRGFLAIRQVNPGFDARNVLTMRMSLTGPQFEKPADVTQIVHEGLRRIGALPGVEAAAATCCVPIGGSLAPNLPN